jgi:nucleotide-binding universal stress UspA family protein
MKLLIGYDGSEHARAAIDGLQRAGLPAAAEAIVLSAADVWLPPTGAESEEAAGMPDLSMAVRKARAQARQALDEAAARAGHGSAQISALFPNWRVAAEAVADSPAWAVIKRATDWPADLIIVGSHGYTSFNRLMLGSVSQKVVAQAPCSVRVSRRAVAPVEGGVRIVIGMDGSADAEAAVESVASRSYPAGSEVRLVAALDQSLLTVMAVPTQTVNAWALADDEDEEAWVRRMIAASAGRLREKGLGVSSLVAPGDPKQMLLDEAESWGADVIFVGVRGLSAVERLLIGSVSSAVAARAHCSVEIVRQSV